jgi:hypothetical protein
MDSFYLLMVLFARADLLPAYSLTFLLSVENAAEKAHFGLDEILTEAT